MEHRKSCRVSPELSSCQARGCGANVAVLNQPTAPVRPSETVTLGLSKPDLTFSLDITMRSSALTFMFALVAPLLAGSSACFLSTEGDSFDGTVGGTSGCQIGTEGCDCTSGGKCNDPFLCNVNLNICISDTCPVGTEACVCTPKGACDPGLDCASGFCVDAGCSPGTEGCQCTMGGGCDPELACLSNLCVDPDSDDTGPAADTTEGASSEEGPGPADTTAGDTDEPPPGTTSGAGTTGGSSSGSTG